MATLGALPEPSEKTGEPTSRGRKWFQHPAENDRYIVVPAIVLGGLDKVVSGQGQVAFQRVHDQLDVGVVHEVIEAVGTKQKDIARQGLLLVEVRGNVLPNA